DVCAARHDHVPERAPGGIAVCFCGERGVWPEAEGRAPHQDRVGLGAQAAHPGVVLGGAQGGEAPFAGVDPPVERDGGVAHDPHGCLLRVICAPAISSPCTGGRLRTVTWTVLTCGCRSTTAASTSATRSMRRNSPSCTARIMSVATR